MINLGEFDKLIEGQKVLIFIETSKNIFNLLFKEGVKNSTTMANYKGVKPLFFKFRSRPLID